MPDLHPALASIAPIFAGTYAAYAAAFVTRVPAATVTIDMCDTDQVRAAILRFAASYGDVDLRGPATLWTKHYGTSFIVPVLAVNILLGRQLPTGLNDLRLILNDNGRPSGFLVSETDKHVPDDARLRFEGLVEGHMPAVTKTLSIVTGLTPRVLWSNFGNAFEMTLAALAKAPGASADGLDAARSLLASRTKPTGEANPLFQPVRYRGVPPVRKRRVCCLRYLIPQLELCGTCPLPARPA